MYKQIMPIKGLYARFKDKDKDVEEREVIALALDEEGEVCPLIVGRKKIVDARKFSDFIKLCEYSGYSEIVQIISASNIRAVFRDKKNEEFYQHVDVIALKDDGTVVPLVMDGIGWFDDPTELDNFIRIEDENEGTETENCDK